MILAHPITGFTVTYITKKFFGKLNDKQEKIVWAVGITTSVLPDFDLILAVLLNQDSHHHFITHTPIFYLVLSLIGAIALYIWELKVKNVSSRTFVTACRNKEMMPCPPRSYRSGESGQAWRDPKIEMKKILFAEQLIILFLANTIIHILMDIPAGSLHPFWPIYDETISLLNLSTAENWFETYVKSSAVFLEAFWFIIGATLIWKNRKEKNFRIALLVTGFWTLVAIIATIIVIGYK